MVLLITGTLGNAIVGCGSRDPSENSLTASEDQTVAPPESTNTQDTTVSADTQRSEKGSETGGQTSSVTNSTESSKSQPAAEGGMQLPEGGLPSVKGDEDKDSGPAKVGDGGIEMPNQAATQPSITDGINLQYATWQEIESLAKTSGKITVVDLWSTSCEPCVKEFPELVHLSDSMKGQIKCIGVSLDYDGRKNRPPETYADAVSGFLKYVGAKFDNFLCETPSDTVYSDVGAASIPAVLIYDAQGKRVKQFVDAGETAGFTYKRDVIPFVEQLANQ